MSKVHPTPINNNRIGFQYYPDTFHYRESDLIAWLPELVSLGAKWLVLDTPADRAIPEDFIRPLISAGIEPILNMHLPLSEPPTAESLSILFDVYANWGVHYIYLFDRPNTLQAWSEESWVQQELVRRFLDTFIPLAELVCQTGLFPIFPALEPGGNFWDTAFLRSALQGIWDRKHTRLLNHLVMGAYAWPGNHHLNWGAGGPELWPTARPYTPPENEDQRGFRIFDWYTSISEAILGTRLPIILLGTGTNSESQEGGQDQQSYQSASPEINFRIAKLLAGETTAFQTPETPLPIPDHVLAGCFTHLVSLPSEPASHLSWYLPDGTVLPIVQKMKEWQTSRKQTLATQTQNLALLQEDLPSEEKTKKPIKHYMLLPHHEWGVASWYLEVGQPYIQKYSPTIGFSMKEAFLAEKVTVVGGVHAYSDQLIHELEKNGSTVIQITGNGTDIATQFTIK